MALTFTLTITLGNEAMQTFGDIASAVELLAGKMRAVGDAAPVGTEDGVLRDTNGNTVGEWRVS